MDAAKKLNKNLSHLLSDKMLGIIVKSILLAISLVSCAVQAPIHAESPVPPIAEKILQGTEAVLTLPFVLAGKGLEGLAKGIEYGANAIRPGVKAIEPTVTPIFEKIGNGLLSTRNGLVHIGTHYPATSIVALSAFSIASWAKGFNCDQNNKRKQANFFMFAGLVSGIASLVVFANVCGENGIDF